MMEGIAELLVITGLGLGSAFLLVTVRGRFAPDENELVETINQVLPQTQCAQCGYPGCRPYAEAVAGGEAINRCPPGGDDTIAALATLLGREATPLDPDCGEEPQDHVVVINEEDCIGCTLCIPVCPVDAIIGAPQHTHTVIADACTGCDLCLEPCPVDCIETVIRQPAIEPETVTDQKACINCSACIEVCPRDLQPQLLFWFRNDLEKSAELRLDDCIECRICDRVCPSEIDLTGSFISTKKLSERHRKQQDAARIHLQRFESHQQRTIASDRQVAKRTDPSGREALLNRLKESS